MMTGGQIVERKVSFRPRQIRLRHINGGGCVGTAQCRVHRCGPGIGKQIQEVAPSRFLKQPLPNGSMVEEQSCVEIIFKIDQQLARTFAHHMELLFRIQLFVLTLTALPRTCLVEYVLIVQIQCGLHLCNQFPGSEFGFLLING